MVAGTTVIMVALIVETELLVLTLASAAAGEVATTAAMEDMADMEATAATEADMGEPIRGMIRAIGTTTLADWFCIKAISIGSVGILTVTSQATRTTTTGSPIDRWCRPISYWSSTTC